MPQSFHRVTLFALALLPAAAHHVISTIYDTQTHLHLAGAVKQVDWINPHIWIYVDVTDSKGKVTRWGCEGDPANVLYKLGWRKGSVNLGDQLVIEGYPAWDGTPTMNATSFRTIDGSVLFQGPRLARPETRR